MVNDTYSELQIREIFHLEFLRFFGRKIKPELYALKGGVNLRLFFNSIRYSEDMDLDVEGLRVHILKDCVMELLQIPAFKENLQSFGIDRIVPPAIERAKQTETTQRFKIHLVTSAGLDLFTKIEFSRRGMSPGPVIQAPSETILRAYKITSMPIPHYDIYSAITQKTGALAGRATIQARDIFDLYILNSQFDSKSAKRSMQMEKSLLLKAHETIFDVKFKVFRDTVVSYLAPEDQPVYDNSSAWEEIQLKTAGFIK
ncbi:MAG: nucleotidyl transferase AbiEii/AbiGii toxin family protein, partial [Candidatus Omnitrophota bacterium]|nr:nucleotidyl transferase AbiEii/AbiGii toxin family protein [Candidatus Omnitrophota bacterium]